MHMLPGQSKVPGCLGAVSGLGSRVSGLGCVGFIFRVSGVGGRSQELSAIVGLGSRVSSALPPFALP